jgi:hypothetical protein
MIIPGNKMDNQEEDLSISTTNSSTEPTNNSTEPTNTSTLTNTTTSTPDIASTSSTQATSISSILEYQPKTFLQFPMEASSKNGEDEFDESGEVLMDEEENTNLITNIPRASASKLQEAVSLEHKIRSFGHEMDYTDISACGNCRRMASKRCIKCDHCVKCGQRLRCGAGNVSPIVPGTQNENKIDQVPVAAVEGITNPSVASAPSRRTNLSVNDRNFQVLTPAMDQAVYNAFKKQDFHTALSLIGNGMDVNFQRRDCDCSTILMAAAQHGRVSACFFIRTLLSHSENGYTKKNKMNCYTIG